MAVRAPEACAFAGAASSLRRTGGEASPASRRGAGRVALVALALGLVAGCSTIRQTLSPLGLTTAPGYAYDVRLEGVGGRLADRLEAASELFTRRHEPPATLAGLRRRAQADRDVFVRVMRSRGWYDGSASWEIDPDAKPPMVTMKVVRGVRYSLARVDIAGLPPDGADLGTPAGLAGLGVHDGDPALAETVLALERSLVAALATRGHPWAELASREARLDRRAHTMEVSLVVDAGPRARFGEVRVEGLHAVREEFVRRRLTFQRGEVFSPARIDETRKALFASGVFSGVSLDWGKRADAGPDGEAPIRVIVAEADFHTIGAGVKWSSVDGAGGHAFWENRNFRGGAERLRAEVDVTQLATTGGVSYRIPDWRSVGQSLLLDARADADEPPAYDRFATSVSAGVERPFSRHLTGTGGVALEQSDVNAAADPGGTKTFTLIGVPMGLRYDGSNDPLDPRSGHRTLVSMTPWFSVLGDSVQMLSMRVTESFYVALRSDERVVWATRLAAGSVVGAERNEMPADKRMYAGGGDSVRGYAFQSVGPLVDVDPTRADPTGKPDWKPQGGRSLLQMGTELRWKVTDTLGLVPFVEGAGVYESSYPDFSQKSRWAAGLGLRYFTVAGPIRFDVAFPVNGRQSDDIFQVYISLGQAF